MANGPSAKNELNTLGFRLKFYPADNSVTFSIPEGVRNYPEHLREPETMRQGMQQALDGFLSEGGKSEGRCFEGKHGFEGRYAFTGADAAKQAVKTLIDMAAYHGLIEQPDVKKAYGYFELSPTFLKPSDAASEMKSL